MVEVLQQPWVSNLTPRAPGLTPRASSLQTAGRNLGGVTVPKLNLTRKGHDAAPSVRPAGMAMPPPDNNVMLPTPRTPELPSTRARHRRRDEAGKVTIHWGQKQPGTILPGPGDGYGQKSLRGEDVRENFKAGQLFGVAEYLHSRGEAIYQSARREPLGRSHVRGHVLPEQCHAHDFEGFGLKDPQTEVAKAGNQAKEAMFPRGPINQPREVEEMYKKTHGSLSAGEALQRGYVWPDRITKDPFFRFGGSIQTAGSKQAGFGAGHRGAGVTGVMAADRDDNGDQPATTIIPRASEDYRSVVNDKLGRSRNIMQSQIKVPPNHAFGAPSGEDEVKGGDVIRGFYTPREQLPDEDLGRCTVPGRRNYHSDRHFGVPSVRRDLSFRPQEKRSVASAVDYGDNSNAYGLVCPQRFEMLGVQDDFHARLDKAELQGLVAASFELSDEDFDLLWKEALACYGDDAPRASLEAFAAVYGNWATRK